MTGYTKISRRDFYMLGGFAHPLLIRVTRSGSWAYYRRDQ